MEITKIIGIGIVGTILSVLVRTYRPELSVGVAIATALAILGIVLPEFLKLSEEIADIIGNSSLDSGYLATIVKIIGISYLSQFAVELAKDAGEGAIARKIEFGGKISILILMMPIVKNLIEVILGTMMSI